MSDEDIGFKGFLNALKGKKIKPHNESKFEKTVIQLGSGGLPEVIHDKLKKKKFKLFTFILMFFTFSLMVQAIDSEYTFKVNENINLIRPCYYNETWCSVAANCFLTVTSQNNTVILNNGAMTYGTSYFYYNLGTLSQTGTYIALMTCTEATQSTHDSFYFDVTPNGGMITNYNGILYGLGMFGITLFALLFVILSTRINFESQYLWIVNVNSTIKTAFLNIAFFCTYILLTFMRYALETQSQAQAMLIRIIDYLIIIDMFLIAAFFIITMLMLIVSFFENRDVVKRIKEEIKKNE